MYKNILISINLKMSDLNDSIILDTQFAAPIDKIKLTQFSLYTFTGFLACASSGLVMGTICWHKILRTKEYAFLAGLAASDFIRGYGYLHGGIIRMLFLCQRVENELVTSHDCLLQIYSSAIMYGQQASSMMILMLSMDRFFAVCFFRSYRSWGLRYSIWTIATINLFCLVVTGAAWIISFSFMPVIMIAQTCRFDTATSFTYYVIQIGGRFFPGPVSALFYLSTFASIIYMRRHRSSSVESCNYAHTQQVTPLWSQDLKRQIKMTKNVSLIMLNTFLFSSLPFGWAFFSLALNGATTPAFDEASPFFYSLSLISASTNILVYCSKYQKFKLIFYKQFSWKVGAASTTLPRNSLIAGQAAPAHNLVNVMIRLTTRPRDSFIVCR